jgi:MauM/NapG family ferredoxin protein
VPDHEDQQEELPRNRRDMFRFGFRRLMEPLAEYLEERLNIQLPVERVTLRPPGALPEKEFLDTCYRCGNCVDVCPARAIRTTSSDDLERAGTPYIDPDLAACVVCDELACMKACPSGALKLVDRPQAIRIGLAIVNHDRCVRSTGEDCTLCIEKCPFGTEAIDLDKDGRIEVKSPGCVGCGVCQFYCPPTPKAIRIDPY